MLASHLSIVHAPQFPCRRMFGFVNLLWFLLALNVYDWRSSDSICAAKAAWKEFTILNSKQSFFWNLVLRVRMKLVLNSAIFLYHLTVNSVSPASSEFFYRNYVKNSMHAYCQAWNGEERNKFLFSYALKQCICTVLLATTQNHSPSFPL